MATARIALTITHRVRTFLRAQQVNMRPWSGLDETYAGLYDLLRERRDDPDFWDPLSALLKSVLAGASDAARRNLPAPNAELLESWDIDKLVKDLRYALQQPRDSSVVGFASRLPQAAMGAFLVFGLVAAGACASRDNDDSSGGDSTTGTQDGGDGGTGSSSTGSSGTGSSSTGSSGSGSSSTTTHTSTQSTQSTQTESTSISLPGWAEGCNLDPTGVIFRTIGDSDLTDQQKTSLCLCLESLNADWNTGLTELFENEAPDVVAAVLEELLECCMFEPYVFDADFAQSRDDLLSGELCYTVTPYRGVTFPHEP
jgi:hypothetical protein